MIRNSFLRVIATWLRLSQGLHEEHRTSCSLVVDEESWETPIFVRVSVILCSICFKTILPTSRFLLLAILVGCWHWVKKTHYSLPETSYKRDVTVYCKRNKRSKKNDNHYTACLRSTRSKGHSFLKDTFFAWIRKETRDDWNVADECTTCTQTDSQTSFSTPFMLIPWISTSQSNSFCTLFFFSTHFSFSFSMIR